MFLVFTYTKILVSGIFSSVEYFNCTNDIILKMQRTQVLYRKHLYLIFLSIKCLRHNSSKFTNCVYNEMCYCSRNFNMILLKKFAAFHSSISKMYTWLVRKGREVQNITRTILCQYTLMKLWNHTMDQDDIGNKIANAIYVWKSVQFENIRTLHVHKFKPGWPDTDKYRYKHCQFGPYFRIHSQFFPLHFLYPVQSEILSNQTQNLSSRSCRIMLRSL